MRERDEETVAYINDVQEVHGGSPQGLEQLRAHGQPLLPAKLLIFFVRVAVASHPLERTHAVHPVNSAVLKTVPTCVGVCVYEYVCVRAIMRE